ncbi:MAG: hypothetical protein WBH57_07880 [Anaerolineae bacterium]
MQEFEDSIDAIEAAIKDQMGEKRAVAARWRDRKELAAQQEEAALNEIGELELALRVLRRVLGKPTPEGLFGGLDMMRFRTQTVAESCFEIISQKGGRAKVTEIIDILIAAGKLKRDRRIAYGTVVKSMERDERFVKVGPGEYGLAETEEALEEEIPF